VNNNINETELQKPATYENLENILRLSNLEHGISSLSSYDRDNPRKSTGTVKSRFLAEKEVPPVHVTFAE
jgi:hypothetical protein